MIAFKKHDVNDTGLLDAEYMLNALLSLHLPVESSDIKDLFECVGREKTKEIDVNDFIDIVTELKGIDEEEVEEEEYHDDTSESKIAETVYQMLEDPTVNGITLDSLLKICATQDESWTKQQIVEMMNEADLNHDGKIDSSEFKLICDKIGLT
ncbi:hypothetical protein BD770DRAFT_415210 [Pilaira anomala]|nr:hypothetical protein BD770DRAFT_415210 [Pilaira anomala]